MDASRLVASIGREVSEEAPAVVPVSRTEDMLLLYRKPRLSYIITDSTVRILVDGAVSHLLHYTGNVAIDTEVPC